MKKIAISTSTFFLLMLLISCSDDDSNGNDGNTNTKDGSYLQKTNRVLIYELYELDENNNKVNESSITEQKSLGKVNILGDEAIALELYEIENGYRDTIYMKEDNDFLYLYIDYYSFSSREGDLTPLFQIEPQWMKIYSFNQNEWIAFEHKVDKIEIKIPGKFGVPLTAIMSNEMIYSGKRIGNENFVIRDRNETIETIMSEIIIKSKLDGTLIDGSPIPSSIKYPQIVEAKVKYYFAKEFGLINFEAINQNPEPSDKSLKSVTRAVDYR